MASVSLSTEDQAWIAKLSENGQAHLFPDSASTSNLKQLIEQIKQTDSAYPGGVLEYLKRAKVLLADARDGVNPFEGCIPERPQGVCLKVGTQLFVEMELLGAAQLALTCYVLVAGGLGERLGYSSIKISLPAETSTNTCYMELYAKHIIAFEEYATKQLRRVVRSPLVIMTSDDTHDKTVDLLAANDNFGLHPDQVTILKQEKVPSLFDSDARISVCDDDPFTLDTKPHGHGDVHILLMKACLPKKWTEKGFKWLVFFQDTNSLVFRSIPAVLGVSAKNDFVMNTIAVPRKPGEAVGGLCRLKRPDGSTLTINVEYNQLEPLLQTTGEMKGDIADESGNSRFPGNTNVFVINIPRYAEVLQNSGGAVPEFANPKYSDSSKTKFKTPARLESMMQDFPKVLGEQDAVGFTEMERWICFSTVKNNREEAAVKANANLPSESAFSGESDHYSSCARLLRMAAQYNGAFPLSIPETAEATFGGVKYQLGPRVVLMPSFAVTFEELKQRLAVSKRKPLVINSQSTLILEGDVDLEGLQLDGTLVARAKPGTKLRVNDLSVENHGWEVKALTDQELESEAPHIQIRGFTILRHESTLLEGTSSCS